jgi:hypothetical protein
MTTDKGAPQAASFACEVAREFLYLEQDGGFDDDAALLGAIVRLLQFARFASLDGPGGAA